MRGRAVIVRQMPRRDGCVRLWLGDPVRHLAAVLHNVAIGSDVGCGRRTMTRDGGTVSLARQRISPAAAQQAICTRTTAALEELCKWAEAPLDVPELM